ncbi:ShlB/FhaC/HecB family hemolysin secretion/activation protein [Herbaspirillum autotrophicum]|uniref:ShlB/FhaC/HecB family hemolysin secretion/activation protein n=1 Tax=Herbaspirillum autotrophicum TaxID=180195 RepID=UPI001E4BA376|nr:ShlB/FhaC/HecB family hemolysin secretion/activation protein [Herbaspirillum autotrophicum]
MTVLLLWASCSPTLARTPASIAGGAREFLRQQEREQATRQQQEAAAHVRLLPNAGATQLTPLPGAETPCFAINTIVLRGDAAEQFNFALQRVSAGDDPAIGRCLGKNGINAVLGRVQNAIARRGFVTTRVLAGAQQLQSGTLVLTLVPGRVRNVRFAADASVRGTKWNALPVNDGDLINLRDLEQGLENWRRVPTAHADIQIVPSDADNPQPGDSDLIIRYQQAFPLRLNLSLDNGGSDATGRYQGSVTLSFDNWWTLNDMFYASFTHDIGGGSGQRSKAYTVHYSLPFGYWTAGLTSNSSDYYQVVAGVRRPYIYSGHSDLTEIKLTRILQRNATGKTSLSLRGLLRGSRNFINDAEIRVQRRRTVAWELGVQHREYVANTTLDLGLAYRRGTGALGALPAPEEKFGEGSARFRIITGNLNLILPFQLTMPWGRQDFRYGLHGRMQWNETPLTAQDRFAIGGRHTVRGFDGEMSLLAERGWLLRNDVGISLGMHEAYLGLDYGEVGGPTAIRLPGTRLAGAVAGVRGQLRQLSYDFFTGTPLSKPDHFATASLTAGFQLHYAF